MPGGIRLTAAFDGVPRGLDRDAFLNAVLDADSSVPTFEFRPPPGEIMASGMDWRALFESGASVASYVSTLWLLYDKLIKPQLPQREPGERKVSLVVMIERGFNPPAVLRLSDETTEAEIQQFAAHAQNLSEASDGPDLPELLWELSSSEVWHPVTQLGDRGHS